MPETRPDPLLEIADDLYALPLAEFTPARDALAKEHKADKALAAAIKGLRKASVAAWVVNLLVRRDPDQVDQVLAVGAALRDAQDNLDATQLREFTKQRRQLTASVTTTARRMAREEGLRTTQAVADQVEATLTAAMLEPDAARAVRSGLLVSAIEATGLGDLDLGAAVAVPEALGFSATPRPVSAPDPARRPQLHVVPDPDADAKARKAADARTAEARAVLGQAEKEHRAARRAVEKLRARTLQLQAEIDELRSRIAELESEVEEVDDELGEAEAVQEEAQEALDEASAEVEAARAARERL
jgi:predicted RNase H-like nuclease (RuvC/YqgF family)